MFQPKNQRIVLIMLIGGFGLSLLFEGCTPNYPKCNKDEHCKSGEFCVNGQCQQCRSTKDCPEGESCNKGRCEVNPACKDDSACGPGMKCQDGKCIKESQCQTDSDCPDGNECHEGICVSPPQSENKAPCVLDPIFFDYDEYSLTSDATNQLKNQTATCLKQQSKPRVMIEGHCDHRGTTEYNLALGDRRAQSVKNYLQRLGIEANRLKKVSKGELEATGTDESGWAKDRRAKFVWE